MTGDMTKAEFHALKQRLFEQAYIALYKQGRRSLTPGRETCAYRGAGDCKCAIGHLIPDDRYDPRFEGKAACADYIMDAVGVPYRTADFLEALQRDLHDALSGGRLFRSELDAAAKRFATTYNLTPPQVPTV